VHVVWQFALFGIKFFFFYYTSVNRVIWAQYYFFVEIYIWREHIRFLKFFKFQIIKYNSPADIRENTIIYSWKCVDECPLLVAIDVVFVLFEFNGEVMHCEMRDDVASVAIKNSLQS